MTAVALMSGGMDSAVLLASRAADVSLCVAVNYGQTHHRELDAADKVCRWYQKPLQLLNLPGLGRAFLHSDLVGGAAPQGVPYTDAAQKTTVVPYRNGVLIALAVALAESTGADTVLTAVQVQGETRIYPDATPAFVASASCAALIGTGGKVLVEAPLNRLSKEDIVRLGESLHVPWYLTWSCYLPGPRPCGQCAACLKRAEGFALAGVKDA